MWLIRTSIVGTDPFGELLSGKESVGFNDRPFPVHPFGFNRVEPGALFGQQKGQDPNPLARLFPVLIVLPDPRANHFADMPGCMIPDEKPGGLAHHVQTRATPLAETAW
jgi:hypothetical protein